MSPIQSCVCGVALLATSAVSAQTAGYIKNVTGQASIIAKGQTTAAQPGAPLSQGDTLRTGPDGSMGVTLRDNTVMSFGPSTSFTLEEYLFAPAKGQLKLGGKIAHGTLHYVSGTIAKLRPEAVQVATPTGIIGVRGTRFVVVVEP